MERVMISFLDIHLFHSDIRPGAIVHVSGRFGDLVNCVHALDHLSESRILTVKEGGILVADKELGACGVGVLCSCHGEYSTFVREAVGNTVHKELALYLFLCAAHTCACGVAALYHEVLYYTVEDKSVIKALAYQL